jgi:hypothetical protein
VRVGAWIAESHPYTATMENTFTPARIKPGEGFTYHSVQILNDPEWNTCCDSTSGPDPYDWTFARVPRGGNLWETGSGSATLTGQLTATYDYEPGKQTSIVHHVVSGQETMNMAPGCYQSDNWNSGLWFPGDDATTGEIGTLVVYDEDNEVWPTCNTCEKDSPDDDQDGFKDTCDDLECQDYQSGIDGCALQPGDILVDRGSPTNAITLINTALGDTYWTHAAIVLGYLNLDYDDPQPTASDCDHVEPRFPGDLDPDCELVIAEATPGVAHPVRIRKLSETVWGNDPAGNTDWNVVRLDGVPASMRRLAAKKLRDLLLFGLGAIMPGNHPRNCSGCDVEEWGASGGHYLLLDSSRGPNYFYCSSLVWWAYNEVGVDLDGGAFENWPWEVVVQRFVTPDEVVGRAETEPRYLRLPWPKGMVHAIFSPAHLMLTDHLGRRTGKTADGTLYEEIPGAIWRDSGESESVSTLDGDPTWLLTISGFDTGKYTLVSRYAGDAYSPPAVVPGFTRPGLIEEVRVSQTQQLQSRPIALDDSAAASAPETLIDALANDYVPDGTQLQIGDPPDHGTAEVAAGKVRYVPAAGYSGADAFTYQACVGYACSGCSGMCTEATVTLNVTSPAPGGTGSGGSTGGSGTSQTGSGPSGSAPSGGSGRAPSAVH